MLHLWGRKFRQFPLCDNVWEKYVFAIWFQFLAKKLEEKWWFLCCKYVFFVWLVPGTWALVQYTFSVNVASRTTDRQPELARSMKSLFYSEWDPVLFCMLITTLFSFNILLLRWLHQRSLWVSFFSSIQWATVTPPPPSPPLWLQSYSTRQQIQCKKTSSAIVLLMISKHHETIKKEMFVWHQTSFIHLLLAATITPHTNICDRSTAKFIDIFWIFQLWIRLKNLNNNIGFFDSRNADHNGDELFMVDNAYTATNNLTGIIVNMLEHSSISIPSSEGGEGISALIQTETWSLDGAKWKHYALLVSLRDTMLWSLYSNPKFRHSLQHIAASFKLEHSFG